MDKKALKRAKKIIEAQLNGNLDPKLAVGIRAWFMGKAHREEKLLALEEQWDKHITESHKATEKLDADFEKITKLLDFPKMEYEKPRLGQPSRKVVPLRRRTMLKVAAVLLPFLFITGAAYLWVDRARNAAEQHQLAEVVVTASGGDRTAVALPDGSTISLASGFIRHNDSFEDKRRVELQGEAYFNVARDTAKTFTVHTDHFSIRVLGTEFRVNSPASEDISTVHLYHGSILVEAGNRELVMLPGQMLTYRHTTGESQLSMIAVGDLEYDRMPNLVFDGVSLDEIFHVLQVEYSVPILIQGALDTDNNDIIVDLSDARSINSVMNILSTATGRFTYEITDAAVIVKATKKAHSAI